MPNNFFGSKLNTVLLLVLIILMVFALHIMLKDKATYLPFVKDSNSEGVFVGKRLNCIPLGKPGTPVVDLCIPGFKTLKDKIYGLDMDALGKVYKSQRDQSDLYHNSNETLVIYGKFISKQEAEKDPKYKFYNYVDGVITDITSIKVY